MFKRLSSTISKKNTKAEVTEAPAKAEPVDAPVVEEKEPVSEIRAEDAPRDTPSETINAMDNAIAKAEQTACANEAVRGAMEYALAQGGEGDAIDQVFSKVEGMTCSPENELLADIKLCKITKFSKDERVGISLRTSLSTDGLYVNAITAGSKFESTELTVGHKVLKINGAVCPAGLADAISLLKGAETTLALVVEPNDEAAKKLEAMGQLLETEDNDIIVKKANVTEIAVDGYADSCGFFWSLQNGLCALQETGVRAIEAPKPIAEAPKPILAEAPKEEEKETPKEEEQQQEVETPKETEEAPKPEIPEKALADEEEAPKDKKKKSFLKKPSLPSIKAPSLSSLKLGKSKSKKVQEVEPSPVETTTGEDGLMTIKFTKDSLDESVGLALRNSVLNENIYVYGIFDGSKLKSSGLAENMRIHTINGFEFSNVEAAVKLIKEAAELEIVAGPNEEPDEPETPEEEEDDDSDSEEEESKSGGWFW